MICLMRAPFDTKIIRFMRRAGRMEIEIDIMGEVVVIPVWILKAMNVDQEVVSSRRAGRYGGISGGIHFPSLQEQLPCSFSHVSHFSALTGEKERLDLELSRSIATMTWSSLGARLLFSAPGMESRDCNPR